MNLAGFLKEIVMHREVVRAVNQEEKSRPRRLLISDIRASLHAGGDDTKRARQTCTLSGEIWNGSEKPHAFTIRETIEKGGVTTAFVHALNRQLEASGLKIDVGEYSEEAVHGSHSDSVESNGAATPTIAYMCLGIRIKDGKGERIEKRAGLGMDPNSDLAKVHAIVNALNRLEWTKDEKGKSIPPALS
jgi:hypothetical protein